VIEVISADALSSPIRYTIALLEENKTDIMSSDIAMKIDLHSHTHFSDGLLSPTELIQRAHNMQVDVLAVTDHDTVAGIGEALDYQKQQKRPLTIVPGIELSTAWHGFDIHILGLNVDVDNEEFQSRLKLQENARNMRAEEIDRKLHSAGCENVLSDARKLAGKGQVTRAHFARAMVQRGDVNDFDGAFKKYLGKGKRAHVSPKWITIETAVTWIQDAGGKAVLAHPAHYKLSAKWLRRLLVYFKSVGGDGMEVSHPNLSPDMRRQLASYAKEYQLLASSGSDFHGPGRWTELGRHTQFDASLPPVWQDWGIVDESLSKERN
jgi:3',5'-nucleoside bisphosphate phosphatase